MAYTRFRYASSIGDLEDALFLSSNTDDYTLAYLRDGFYAKTPMFRWMSENDGVCTWRWVDEAFKAGTLSPVRNRSRAPEPSRSA